MDLNRRDFLKTGSGMTAMSLGLLGGLCPPFLQRRALAGLLGTKKLLFIFQRGGMDGINAVIPRGDSDYNTTTRPTLYIPSGSGIDLGNGFAQLNPQLSRMMDVFNAGDLAVIHRVGYEGQSRSHFDSQQYWENGTRDRNLEVGIFNRHLTTSPAVETDGFSAAALSSGLPVALRGPRAIPNFNDPRRYRFRGTTSEMNKFLGQSATTGEGRGLLGFYDGTQDFPGKSYRNEVYGAGVVLTDTMAVLAESNVNQNTYVPENGADYGTSSFMTKVRLAAQLFKETPVQILGCNIGGWDTHTNQSNNLNGLLYEVAHAYEALHLDLQSQWNDIAVITMTEFGRTSNENGSFGTDHAEATAMFVAGGAVNGGVYNCDSSTWRRGDMFSINDRYLSHRTDFRSIMGEIFRGHFGDSDTVVNTAIPDYDGLAVADPDGFTSLGLF